MIVRKSLKVPIHYDTTKTKIRILDRLTARITYTIQLISELITEDTEINRKTIRKLVKDSDIVAKTGLSSGFVQQCIDKFIWAWKSYHRLHRTWERQAASAEKRVASARDDKELKKRQKSFDKILKREPSIPDFRNKTPCRIDNRTGSIEHSASKLTPLWMHVSTLIKNQTIDVPLNPSQYHLNQLTNAEISDFEIVKHGKKYYVHITITKVIEDQPISSIGGIDQGLNKSIAAVLLTEPYPQEEQLLDSAKRELLEKYDEIVSSLQEAKRWAKLRELRNEYGTSKKCHECQSKLITRKWGEGHSYILCHSCGAKIDADFNAGYNIATQCRDDMLKAGMNMEKIYASL